MVSFQLLGCFGAHGRVSGLLVVCDNPGLKGSNQLERAGPRPPPQACFFEGAHEARGIGMALGIMVTGEGLLNLQRRTSSHKGRRGGLAAMVTHRRQALATGPAGELAVRGHVHCGQPVPRGALQAGIVPHALLRLPVQDHNNRDPAEALDHDLAHLNAPPLIGFGRRRFMGYRGTLGFQPAVGRPQEMVLPHQAQKPLLVDLEVLDEVEVRPDSPLAPARRRSFAGLNPREQALILLDDPTRPTPLHASNSSLFFHSRSSAPTSL
jgi:hypothetical protein